MTCEFAVASKQCGEPATHIRRMTVQTMLKGQPHDYRAPDAFYCDRHAELVRLWNDGSKLAIKATVERI